MTIGRLILNFLAAPFGALIILIYAIPYVLLLIAAIYFAPMLQLPETATTALADMAAGPVSSVVGSEGELVTPNTIQTALTSLILGFLTLLLIFQLQRIAGRIVDIGGYNMASNYIFPARAWFVTSGFVAIILGALIAYVLNTDTNILEASAFRLQLAAVPSNLKDYLLSAPVQGVFLTTAVFFGLSGVSGIKRAGYLEGIGTFARGFPALLIMSFVFTVLVATMGFFFQMYVIPALELSAIPRVWVLLGEAAFLWAIMSYISAAWFKRMTIRVYDGAPTDMKQRLLTGFAR